MLELDDELRARLGRRFGAAVGVWLDALPPTLGELAARWQLELESLVQRGTVSVVIRCRTADGGSAVLKLSPARTRVAQEAAALAGWRTPHVPAVLAADDEVGALLIEAIEPGTALDECAGYPNLERVGELMRSLHAGAPTSRTPVAERVAYLFDSGLRNYERRPDLADVIPPALYERGRRLALRLAATAPETVLLHGDLTPVNVLDGGERGLVAIDPAPCAGDPAFDAVDLVLWHAEDAAAIGARAEALAPAIGAEPGRLVEWCAAFAAMAALEAAEAPGDSQARVEMLVALAEAET